MMFGELSIYSLEDTPHRAGDILGGVVRGEHPEGPTECRMGESPERERSERRPGTQGAERPSSFRRGREGARVPVRASWPFGGVSA